MNENMKQIANSAKAVVKMACFSASLEASYSLNYFSAIIIHIYILVNTFLDPL
jgi:hypothetical protein